MGDYALWVALRLVLPGALLCCGLLVMWRVSGLLRVVGLVLLGIGACAIVFAALSGAIRSPTPLMNAPALIAAFVVFPLAGIALVRSAAPRGRRLSSAHAASTLLILAAVVQFFAPWLLASGE